MDIYWTWFLWILARPDFTWHDWTAAGIPPIDESSFLKKGHNLCDPPGGPDPHIFN